jgi:hypothetical protein
VINQTNYGVLNQVDILGFDGAITPGCPSRGLSGGKVKSIRSPDSGNKRQPKNQPRALRPLFWAMIAPTIGKTAATTAATNQKKMSLKMSTT